ncbi:MAG: hypothetical protein DRQ55_14825, partial [Planctomycetota bacterium]
MSLGQVSLVFLLQMALGGVVTELLGDRAALGPKYAKVSGWILAALLGLAMSLCAGALWDADATLNERWLALSVMAGAAGVLVYASFAGWDKPALELSGLVLALLGCGAAVGLSAGIGVAAAGGSPAWMLVAGAYTSALVLGFNTWGMILGHWYLVAPGLPIKHLARMVAPLPWVLLAKTVVSGAALWLGWSTVLGGEGSLSDLLARHPGRVIDVVNIAARVPVG